MARWITRAVTVAALGLAPVVTSAQSLTQTLTNAYRSSGLLEQNRALLRAADEDVATAMAALRPILDWSVTASANRTSSKVGSPRARVNETTDATLRLTASMLLYDFGASQFAIDAAKETVLATRARLIAIEQDVLQRAVNAHLELQRATNLRDLRQSNLRLVTRELNAARDRFEVGEITRTDVSFAEARLASSRAQLASAEGTLARAVEEYVAVTGQRPGFLKPAGIARLGRSKAEARAYALRNHPSVLQIRHSVAAAELGVKRADAQIKPTVQLRGSVSLNDELASTQNLNLSVGGPIYRGGALASNIRRAMAQRDSARAQLHVASDQISQQVGSAYAIFNVTGQSLAASDRQVTAAQAAFDGIREEASLGSRTTLDVLDAEQTLLDAQVAAISARIDRVAASYSALAAMGDLTAADLRLPVQLYDPTDYYRRVERAPALMSKQGRALDRVLRKIGE